MINYKIGKKKLAVIKYYWFVWSKIAEKMLTWRRRIMQQDSIPSHKSMKMVAKLLSHQTYATALIPNKFFLLSDFKRNFFSLLLLQRERESLQKLWASHRDWDVFWCKSPNVYQTCCQKTLFFSLTDITVGMVFSFIENINYELTNLVLLLVVISTTKPVNLPIQMQHYFHNNCATIYWKSMYFLQLSV